ncbi:MAG: Em GEA1 (EM1) [Actinobacteria bacterium]|nr:Em GEA1 (EM1) [Actinomycetota bacterium]
MAAERRRMTVSEAGHLGGAKGGKKGGEATKKKYGHEFYEEIGHKGGQKVKRLIEAAEKAEKAGW